MSKIFTKLHNRTRKIKSFILTKFYSKLFYRVGSVKVWGNIEVSYPQNIIVGKNCSINSGVHLNAYNPIVIGDNVTISANSMLISTGLNIEKWLLRAQGDKHIVNEGIYIGNNIWIGANSIILGGVKLSGENIIVAAGSIVTKSFNESNIILAGSPAKIVREVE